jgi:hypothetical protein
MHAKLKGPIAGMLVGFVSVGAALAGGGLISPSAISATNLLNPILVKPDAALPGAVTPADRHSIEDAVRVELRALVAQDAKRAFATLAPSAQSFFGKPDKFLRSVAEEMPPILLTRTFAFLGAERTENRTVQQVLITDSLGQQWLAEFQVERQQAGDWRVKGCVVAAAPGQQA